MARKRKRIKATQKQIISYMAEHRVRAVMIRKAARRFGTRATARALGVKPAHISNVETRGVSDILNNALIRAGLVNPPRQRHGRYYHAGYGGPGLVRVRDVDRMIKDRGFDSLTEMVDHMLAQWRKEKEHETEK